MIQQIGFVISLLCFIFFILWGASYFFPNNTANESRLLQVVKGERQPLQTHARDHVESWLSRLSTDLKRRLGIHTDAKTLSRLQAAGYRNARAADIFFIAQYGLPVLGVFAGSIFEPNPLFWSFVGVACGYLLPNMWVSWAISKRNELIRRGLPDTIDLLVICVDAGLGLDQAILRVSEELKDAHPEIHQELLRVQLEQRAGRPRLESWQNLADRAGVREVSEFVNMLTQTERFGTPVGKALAQFAEDMRLQRRQRAEEMAAKMKIKIIFPLVFCIFPCLFFVLLAPALIRMSAVFSGLKK